MSVGILVCVYTHTIYINIVICMYIYIYMCVWVITYVCKNTNTHVHMMHTCIPVACDICFDD